MQKIIHQIWVGPYAMPQNEVAWTDMIRNAHPDYEYMFWHSENLPPLEGNLKGMFDKFASYGEWVRIADALRYYLVCKYGGLYIDADYELINPITELNLESHRGFLPLHFSEGETICNSIFGFEKGHPIIQDRVDELLTIAEDADKWDSFYKLPWLGPHFLGRGLKKFIGYDADELDVVISPTLESEWGVKTMHSREELKVNWLCHHLSYNWGAGANKLKVTDCNKA